MLEREQKPMLAKLVRELPEGDVRYEPKWDGFRCLAVRLGGLPSRSARRTRRRASKAEAAYLERAVAPAKWGRTSRA